MGIKKIARPMNKAKNSFVSWLMRHKADNIDGIDDKPTSDEWDYYMVISGFIGNNLYTASFMVWRGKERIDYSDEENRYCNMSIAEFIELLH